MNSDNRQPAVTQTRNARRRFMGGLPMLVFIAGATTAVVSVVATSTRDRIAANQSARAMRTVAEVLPPDVYNNSPDRDVLLLADLPLLGSSELQPAYRARFGDIPSAIALTVTAPEGYIAPIKLLVGIDSEGHVIAVRSLTHLETPGLGDQIDIGKSDWIVQFNGRSLSDGHTKLALRRDGGDLDQISGATITSRAVSKAVRNALKYYDENQEQLFEPIEPVKISGQEP